MTQVGDRVELLHCDYPHTRLRPGDRGTVTLVNTSRTFGTYVYVQWDSGPTFALVAGKDVWRVISDESGYSPDDPKHPTYHERMADVWDNRDKTAGIP